MQTAEEVQDVHAQVITTSNVNPEANRVQALIEEATELKHLTNDLWEAANTHGLIALFNEKRKALGGE